MSVEDHVKERNRLFNANFTHSFQNDEDFDQSVDELAVQGILEQLIGDEKIINPRVNFLAQVDDYEKSGLVQLLKMMPKGAHLHLHNIATGCFRKLAKVIREMPEVFVSMSKDNATYVYGSFHFFKHDAIPKGCVFKPAKDLTEDFIFSLITIPKEFSREEEKSNHFEDPWAIFQNLWTRVMGLAVNTKIYEGRDSYYYDILKDQYESGVRYLEIRSYASDEFYRGTERISSKEYFKACKRTVDMFKEDYPDFIGVKNIPCSVKFQSNEDIHRNIINTISLKNDPEVGETIVGYDLVGAEDKLRPVADYIKELKYCSDHGVDLVLHAGETHDSNTHALYDAFLLGSKRLGHAYDLVNHPLLMEEVKKRGICVECCPISNHCLGYCEDMRNHNGRTMVKHGVFVAISADDPGMFGYWNVSYDWALITKAWGLSLKQIRNMCRRSFSAGRLSTEEVKLAEENFDKDWNAFLKAAIKKFGNH